MSFYTDASLVMIPSGYKDGKVYCAKPIDGSADLTFSRGSDIEATRVAANGYIEKAKVNLLLQSNSFSTTWATANASVTSGQSGYDGSSDAWLLEAPVTDSSSRVYQSVSIGSGVKSLSVYAKEGTTPYFAIEGGGSSGFYAYFNLSTGTKGTSGGSVISSKIESVGGGWHRVSVSGNPLSLSVINILVTDANNSTSVTAGANIYIQDAQLNYGLVAQEYQETTTTSVVAGITNDMPRLDYSGGASCPSLKLEPSRSNILPQSEFFGASDWVKINTSVTTNATTSPEGVVNASSLTENTSSGFHVMYDNIVAAFSTAHTLSAFVKPNGRSIIYLRMENASTGGGLGITYFNVSTGQILTDSSTSSSIEAYANGWYRVSITATTPAATSTLFAIGLADADNSRSYTGDGTSGIYLYGAQAEPSASYPSSMIPTYGTSETRTADACSKTGISSLIGQTEGTIYAEVDFDSSVDTEGYIIRIDESSFDDTIFVARGGDKILSGVLRSGGSTIIQLQQGAFNGVNKLAFAYKSGSFALYVNGTQVATSAAIYTNGITYDEIRIGGFNASTANMCGGIKQALLFKTRLSNADLATLTA